MVDCGFKPQSGETKDCNIGICCFSSKHRVRAKQGRIQDFKLGGVLFKNIVGVFCVKNHDFMPKNHIFSNFRGRACRLCRPCKDWLAQNEDNVWGDMSTSGLLFQ